MGSGGSKDRSPRRKVTKAERLQQEMADASTSGIIPLIGMLLLAVIFYSVVAQLF